MNNSKFTTIISAEDLARHLNDPDWAVVDCRFDLKNPDWGYSSYQEAHIPGSVYAHMDRDLSGPLSPETGRHPLPDIQQMTERLSAWGISSQTQVIVYDTSGGAYAVRLWWQLRFLGHRSVAVLDGGFQAWQQAGFLETTGVEERTRANFVPEPNWQMIANAQEVEDIRLNPAFRLVDARAKERFQGIIEPIDPIAGHIPGAVNRFHGDNLDSNSKFLSSNQLKEQFQNLIGEIPPERVIFYCGSGVTSCHHILAMEIAGMPNSRLYVGSWSEWIRNPDRPVAKF